MTAVAPKSSLITAYESRGLGAPSFGNPLVQGGRLRGIVAVTDVAAADSDADLFHVCPVFTSWRIDGIPVKCDAITAGSAYELGLFSITSAYVAAAVDADCYATAFDMSTAITKLPVDLREEALDIALAAQAVWQDPTGGASADPKTWYYLTYTGTTVGSAAGQIVTRVRYVDGS